MEMLVNPPRADWPTLVERNTPDDGHIDLVVADIIAKVKRDGDAALRDMAMQYDRTRIDNFEVSADEIALAAGQLSPELKTAIGQAFENIMSFHTAQMPKDVIEETVGGVNCLQRAVAIQRVGIYIPGGQAPLFSTVLMLAIPAKIAGCREVVLCTPQTSNRPINPAILYAAKLCGVHKIYRIGGAQAIAAMAYGTESIPRVDKIFGPGNRYVTKAKQMLSTVVAIDMPAGPSEVLVMADDSANPTFVAADMLSQAEHGPDSQAMLVCQSREFADEALRQVRRLTARLKRGELIEKSLSHSRIIVLNDRREMIDFANAYAAEHLIISMIAPWSVAHEITAAGSIFIGNYSPESAGDYASGTNHTLPTGGWARSFSGVNIDSFMRKITYQELSFQGLSTLAPTIIAMAEAEGLDAHANAVKIRLSDE
jgi:histidinol dehydrogenase